MRDNTTTDDVDAQIGELVEETRERHEEREQTQEEILNAVAEESDTAELETTVNLVGNYTVTASAKLYGELMDKLADIDERQKRITEGKGRVAKIPELAEEISELLADIIDDPEYDADLFYAIYEQESAEILGEFIQQILESLQAERERQQGAIDGFRQNRQG